jgi:hypothetical protein
MCDCIKRINEYLEPKNTQVTPTIAVSGNTFQFLGVRIETQKIDTSKRGKPVSLIAAYCPFCGQKYEQEET